MRAIPFNGLSFLFFVCLFIYFHLFFFVVYFNWFKGTICHLFIFGIWFRCVDDYDADGSAILIQNVSFSNGAWVWVQFWDLFFPNFNNHFIHLHHSICLRLRVTTPNNFPFRIFYLFVCLFGGRLVSLTKMEFLFWTFGCRKNELFEYCSILAPEIYFGVCVLVSVLLLIAFFQMKWNVFVCVLLSGNPFHFSFKCRNSSELFPSVDSAIKL